MKPLVALLCLLLCAPAFASVERFEESCKKVAMLTDEELSILKGRITLLEMENLAPTYWRVNEEGQLVAITEKQQRREEVKHEIKRYYVPFVLGIVGVTSLTPIGMGLGMYLIFTASGEACGI